MKIAFLDRDGTINKDYPDHEWTNVKEPELLEGSIKGIQNLLELGYQIIIITNQYIINDGIISLDDYHHFTEKLIRIFEDNDIHVLDIFYCPHNDSNLCNCKKPKPGMIQKALEKYDIDLSASIYCGDSESDCLLAEFFHIPFYGINYKGHESRMRFKSLLEVSEYIKKSNC